MTRRIGGTRTVVGVLALAVPLAGCSGSMFGSDAGWFSRKPELFTAQSWGVTEVKKDTRKRTVTSEDLVDTAGYCVANAPDPALSAQAAAPPAVPAAPAAEPPQNGAPMQLGTPVASTDPMASPVPAQTPLVEGGIGLEMTECDVVRRAGHPERIEMGAGPERTVVLTYVNGPRPGIYHFVDGRLREIERAPEPPAPPKPVKSKKKRHA